MKTVKNVILMLIVFLLILGCSGNNANIKNLSESESEVTQHELEDNWSDYNIRYNGVVIVIDPKNDDKTILVPNYWSTVKDQDTWDQLVNGTVTAGFRLNQVWGNEIREIWIPENQLYGYVIHQPRELVSARMVDENTLRLFHNSNTDRRVWN